MHHTASYSIRRFFQYGFSISRLAMFADGIGHPWPGSLGPGQQPLQPPVPARPMLSDHPFLAPWLFWRRRKNDPDLVYRYSYWTTEASKSKGVIYTSALLAWSKFLLDFPPSNSCWVFSNSPSCDNEIIGLLTPIQIPFCHFQMNSILMILIFTKLISFSVPQNDQRLCSRVPKHLRIPRDHNWTIDDTGGTLLNPILKPLYKSCLLMVKPHQMYSNHLMKHEIPQTFH